MSGLSGAEKRAKAWEQWAQQNLTAVPPSPPAVVADENVAEFAAWAERAGLPTEPGQVVVADPMDGAVERYGLFVSEDGEFPQVRLFGSLEAMVRSIGKLEGQDVAVFPFYGTILPLTRGPARAVLLPEGGAALVPAGGKGVFQVLEHAENEVQADGYLGPEALVSGKMAGKLAAKAKQAAEAAEQDEEEEEEEEPPGYEDDSVPEDET